MNIAGVPIGGPCRFVAELSGNHNGSLDRALEIIHGAKAARADFVKFQAYTPDELVALRGDGPAPEPWGAQGWTMRRLYEKAQTPLAWFPRLVAECERIRLPWFSSVFGPESLVLLESLDCPAYKIARLDNQSAFAQVAIGGKFTRTIASEATFGEGVATDLTLWCPPGYPQASFAGMADRFDVFDGLSYHGTDPRIPFAAAMMGATIIEAHVQLSNAPSELEAEVSLTLGQFRQLVDDVRAVEAML